MNRAQSEPPTKQDGIRISLDERNPESVSFGRENESFTSSPSREGFSSSESESAL